MKWSSRQSLLPIVIGLSLTGVGAVFLYLLLKKDDSETSDSRRTRIETSRQSSVEFKVPRQFVPVIIGRGGATIKDIQSSTDTSINFAADNVECPDRVCYIRGKPESIRLAEAMLKNIIASQPIIETYELFVPQQACGRILGRGGETIQLIQSSSGAKIIMERGGPINDPSFERRIIIKGTAEQIASALTQVEDKVREENEARGKLEASLAARQPRGKISPRSSAVSATDNASQVAESLTAQNSDGLMEVYVSAMENPSQFWVQVVGPGALALDKLVQEMTLYYNDEENRELHALKNITVGQIVAAKFSFDNNWYRAEVTSIEKDGQYGIYFVDYGDHQITDASDMLELRTDFLSLRLQAIECSLANVKPRDGEWNQDACDRFADLSWVAQWKVLIAKVRGYKERALGRGRSRREGSPIPCVELYDRNDNKDVNIGKELIIESIAEPEDGSWSAASSTVSLSRRSHDPPITTMQTSVTSSPMSTVSPDLPVSRFSKNRVIPEIDLTTPKKSTGPVEEVDLVTPMKSETRKESNDFIDNEKKAVVNGSGDYTRNGSAPAIDRSTKPSQVMAETPKKRGAYYPEGYESDLSVDSDELEMG